MNPDEYEALFGAPPPTTESSAPTPPASPAPTVATLTPPPIPAGLLAAATAAESAAPEGPAPASPTAPEPTPPAPKLEPASMLPVHVPGAQPAEPDLAILFDDEPEPPGYWKWALGGAALGALIAFLLTVLVIRPSQADRAAQPVPASAALADVQPSQSMEGEPLTDTEIALAQANLDDATVRPILVADTPYSRGLYRTGGWPDTDADCQNNRTEVLLAEATGPVDFRADGCAVLTGQWIDPFSGVELTHTNTLTINHLVPLAEAHRSGAWQWTDTRRADFAADVANPQTLVVVSTPIDQGKGDRRPDQWRPPLRSAWCGYAVDWIAVKTEWDLAFVPSEVDALRDMLDTCVR